MGGFWERIKSLNVDEWVSNMWVAKRREYIQADCTEVSLEVTVGEQRSENNPLNAYREQDILHITNYILIPPSPRFLLHKLTPS